MNETLFYFTNSYPYGLAENWKRNELNILKDYFEKIYVIPYHFGDNHEFRGYVDHRIEYIQPLFPNWCRKSLKKQLVALIFSIRFFGYLKEAMRNKVYLNKKKAINWISCSYTIHSLLKHPKLEEICKTPLKNSVFYFFWGREAAEMIPFIPLHIKVACRFHGYDLYEEDYGGYLPYQFYQLKRIDLILPCSKNGWDYLAIKYPFTAIKSFSSKLGVLSTGKTSRFNLNGTFTIVSCSSIIELKRLHLIAESISKVGTLIKWIHIGDGPLRKEIISICDNIKKENEFFSYEFIGILSNDAVFEFYSNNAIDLFINTSSTEGIPISIMEALSMGIPVIASNVGGTKEIVSREVGFLFEPSSTPNQIADLIIQYMRIPQVEKNKMSEQAQKLVLLEYDAYINAKNLAIRLTDL